MKLLSLILSVMLVLVPLAEVCAEGQRSADTRADHVKRNVTKLGVGSKARATVKLLNGTKVKGYVYSAGTDEFVIRDRKRDTPTTIRYAEVKSIDDNRGHSLARNILIVVGIGAVVTVVAVFGAIARNER